MPGWPGLSIAELEARFYARRCYICGAQADVLKPGEEATWKEVVSHRKDGSTVRYMRRVKPAVADVNLCLNDAARRWGVVRREAKVRKRRAEQIAVSA
jgi:hypothetical protein